MPFVKCIDSSLFFLTKEKLYQVIEETSEFFMIKNNLGHTVEYLKERFEIIE